MQWSTVARWAALSLILAIPIAIPIAARAENLVPYEASDWRYQQVPLDDLDHAALESPAVTPGPGQNAHRLALRQELANQVRADEARAARDQDIHALPA